MIYVTKPYLPDSEKYLAYVKDIWQREYLTNNGPLVQELERQLSHYFQASHVAYTSNGTISLQIAMKAFQLTQSEIITTPFSYVATTSSIVWEGCTPIFADIDPNTFNIDPSSVASLITPKTKAILATHVFGNPCAIEELEQLAQQHNLVIIYDAAHCFGTEYKGASILKYGNVSSISFHATKLFQTIEGGALVCNDVDLDKKFRLLRNFGHDGFDKYTGVGINGKNSEFHAAMGLCLMPDIEVILDERKRIFNRYQEELNGLPIHFQQIQPGTTRYNHAYVPVLFDSEATMLKVKKALEDQQVFSRRYFYPSLNTLDYVNSQSVPVSSSISSRILCLPTFHGLEDQVITFICSTIKGVLRESQ